VSHSYRDLIAWQKAKRLAVEIYRLTAQFPKTEQYGLTSQIQRASISVVSNIAEGQGRLTVGEFAQFLGHARGSLQEMESQLEISLELGYITDEQLVSVSWLSGDVAALVNRLIESLRKRNSSENAVRET
jgi:four helix bundle protein